MLLHQVRKPVRNQVRKLVRPLQSFCQHPGKAAGSTALRPTWKSFPRGCHS